MQTTREISNVADPIEESGLRDSTRTNNNQAATADILLTLSPGLYLLEVSIQAFAAIAQPVTAADTGARITIEFGNTQASIVGVFFGALSSQTAFARIHVLIPVQFTLVHRVAVTAVAQTVISRSFVNAARLL
jgi:hypothetical protein